MERVRLHSAEKLFVRKSLRDMVYTSAFGGVHESIDQILLSPHFDPENDSRIGAMDYLRVLNDHLTDAAHPEAPYNKLASDHGQLIAHLRFLGQEATLELEVSSSGRVDGRPLAAAFLDRYQALYGYRPPERPIEVDSLRVVASSRPAQTASAGAEERAPARDAVAAGERQAFFGGRWQRVPVFDGPEDRNGRRNHDEIRLLADYITPAKSSYLTDDQGVRGGLAEEAAFVILGDMNADPHDGASRSHAARQLLEHRRSVSRCRELQRSHGRRGLVDGSPGFTTRPSR